MCSFSLNTHGYSCYYDHEHTRLVFETGMKTETIKSWSHMTYLQFIASRNWNVKN